MTRDEMMVAQRQRNQEMGLTVDEATLRNQVYRMEQTTISEREMEDSKRMVSHVYDSVKSVEADADIPAAEVKAWADYKTKHMNDGEAAFRQAQQVKALVKRFGYELK